MSWSNLLLVGLGGALGAILRLSISVLVGTSLLFPWATLAINIAGSFAIGVVWGASGHTEWFQLWGRVFLVMGLLGGFTTFSTFSMETLNLLHSGRWLAGLSYVLASVVGCLVAVFLGERLGVRLLS